jgi:hypothetical protein
MSENIEYQMPLTDDIYCYCARAGDRYHLLVLSYLVPFMITNHHALQMKLGERLFIGVADVPMFLIPYDDPDGVKHATIMENVDLHPSGKPIPPEMLRSIYMPKEFSLSVEPYFHFKIENDQLYKKEEGIWQKVQILG